MIFVVSFVLYSKVSTFILHKVVIFHGWACMITLSFGEYAGNLINSIETPSFIKPLISIAIIVHFDNSFQGIHKINSKILLDFVCFDIMASQEAFPKLQPAMTILVEIAAPVSIGSTSKGYGLNAVPMTGGTATSCEGFEPKIEADFEGVGNDYIGVDPDGKHMRLDARGVLRNKDPGSSIFLHYTGVVDITPELELVLSGSPEAKTTAWGNSFTHLKFDTGDEKLKALEDGVFVACGRFVIEEGKPVTVEYHVSRVVM